MSAYLVGFEQEMFCTIEGVATVAPNYLPHDNCGWLFELRGKPAWDIFEAICNLDYAAKCFDRQLTSWNAGRDKQLTPVLTPFMPVSRSVRELARRNFRKDLTTERNLYGHTRHRNRMTEGVAALHVSVTRPRNIHSGSNVVKANQMWDYARFIREMDEAFKQEIKDAKRRPGFYDLHADGRFEYRSLPCTVDWAKVERELLRILDASLPAHM